MISYEQQTHYIDRTVGCAMPVASEFGKITDVNDANFKGKLKAVLMGKTIEEAQAILDGINQREGLFLQIKPK